MKKWIEALILSAACLVGICGCAQREEPEDHKLIHYEVQLNADTETLINGDLEFAPFSKAEDDQIGKEIGEFTFPDDDSQEYVYELEGQSADEWIVVTGENKSDPMIYKELGVTKYPKGFESEYPWN